MEMNHGSISGCQRPTNRVRCGKKKQRKRHGSSKLFLCRYSNTDCILGPLGPNLLDIYGWCKVQIRKDSYFDPLNDLWNIIKCKCQGLLSRKLCLLCDYTKPHTIHLIKLLLKDFKWKVFERSPYSLTSHWVTTTCSQGSRKNGRQWFVTHKELVAAA